MKKLLLGGGVVALLFLWAYTHGTRLNRTRNELADKCAHLSPEQGTEAITTFRGIKSDGHTRAEVLADLPRFAHVANAEEGDIACITAILSHVWEPDEPLRSDPGYQGVLDECWWRSQGALCLVISTFEREKSSGWTRAEAIKEGREEGGSIDQCAIAVIDFVWREGDSGSEGE